MNKWTVFTVASILFLASAIPARGQLVDLRADWPKGECLQNASPAATARFKITGPGRLELHLYLDPYRHAGRSAFVPLLCGGDWSKAHKDSIINYITWDGSKWTAKITYAK